MVEYKCLSIKQARDQNLPEAYEFDYLDDSEAKYRSGIWEFVDGAATRVLAFDGGEPEDNLFIRDGNWIAPALNEAYQKGRADNNG